MVLSNGAGSPGTMEPAQIPHGEIMSADIAGVSSPKNAKCEFLLVTLKMFKVYDHDARR